MRKNRPNKEFFYPVFSCIQSKYGKIRTRNIPYLDTFHAVVDINNVYNLF